jgi:hypothetical protein
VCKTNHDSSHLAGAERQKRNAHCFFLRRELLVGGRVQSPHVVEEAALPKQCRSRQGPADNLLGRCSQRYRHEPSRCLASCCGAHMQSRPQKKVARAYRIDGSIVLYRPAARSLFKTQGSLLRAERWWSMVFGAPLLVRALLRLVFLCRHWHKGPPITLRESIPPNLPGCRSVHGRQTYVTCLDCGQKFAYNSKTRRLVDFWGVHDAEALAGVRRRVLGFFLHLRGLVARVSRLNMRIPMNGVVRSLHRLGF